MHVYILVYVYVVNYSTGMKIYIKGIFFFLNQADDTADVTALHLQWYG